MDERFRSEQIDDLAKAMLTIETQEEAYRFFEDISTVAEIKALAQRMEVARMLDQEQTYTEIVKITGASTATISRVKRKMNPKLHIMGILITMVDYRTIYAKEITEVLYEHYGSSIHIFDDVIPLSVRAAEASAEGVSIYKYDGKGKVAAAYEKIVEEVLANEQ